VEEKQRELATNRLLDIIRSGRGPGAPAPTAPSGAVPPVVKPAPDLVSAAATAESSPREAAPSLREAVTAPAAPSKPEAEPKLEPEEAAALEPAWKRQLKGLLPQRKPREKKPESEAPAPRLKLRKPKGKAKRYIGLDIGTSAIKMVELSRRDNDIQLTDARIVPITPAIRKSQAALEMFQIKTIRDLLPIKKVDKAGLHVVLADQAMQVRTVSLPVVSAKERENAIKFQIKKELPFPLETADITYAGWDPKLKEKQEVEVLAADHRSLLNRLNLLRQSDLTPNHLTSFPAAASNLTRGYRGLTPDKGAVAIVDIGAAKTTITVLGRDRVALCRTIATGGDDFTAVLQGLGLGPDGEDLNEVQAEAYKKNLGLPPEGDTTSMRVAILMRPVAERISAEIARSLELYRRNTMGGEIQKVVLVGGGALMIRLARFLARNVGIEVEIGDPLARVAPAAGLDDDTRRLLADRGPELIPALGVALDSYRRQNLLPQEIKNFHRLREAKRVIAPAAAAVLVALITLYSVELRSFARAEQLSKVLKEQLATLPVARDAFVAAKADFERSAAELAIRDQDFAQIRIEDPEIKAYLKSLSNLVPENIYLERLRTRFIPQLEQLAQAANAKKGAKPEDEVVAPPKTIYSILAEHTDDQGQFVNVKRPVYGRVLEVMGNVYPQGSLTDVQLVDFVFSLEKCGYFRDVAVDSAATLENGKVQFTILCGI